MGPYVVDFACLGARLLIEVDGGQHVEDIERDNERTAWLKSQGELPWEWWRLHSEEKMEPCQRAYPPFRANIPPNFESEPSGW
jgi:very-short-patch-repair endonuclease